jgi:hypothetical protein
MLCSRFLLAGLSALLFIANCPVAEAQPQCRSYTYDQVGNLAVIGNPDFQTDRLNCGSCGHQCSSGSQCVGGLCSAPPAGGGSSPAPYESVECFVHDDGFYQTGSNSYYYNTFGPTDAIRISTDRSGNSQACIPGEICEPWFGNCRTTKSAQRVFFRVFNDGYADPVGPSDSVWIPKSGNQACLSTSIPSGAIVIPAACSTLSANPEDCRTKQRCRRWFGATTEDGRPVKCKVFEDDYFAQTAGSDAIYIAGPIPDYLANFGSACIPGGESGICKKWFGRCFVQDPPQVPIDLHISVHPGVLTSPIPECNPELPGRHPR